MTGALLAEYGDKCKIRARAKCAILPHMSRTHHQLVLVAEAEAEAKGEEGLHV